MSWEESRRRTEVSIARKRAIPVPNGISAGGDGQDAALPTTSGAMDSLLEKLRAAAPQARDQRDRRRRARLKERNNVRVASGPHEPPEAAPSENVEDSGSKEETKETKESEPQEAAGEQEVKPTNQEPGAVSEGDDIADRAASMLQGLRQDGASDRTKRKEGAEEARRNRRLRRRMLASGTSNKEGDGGSAAEEPPNSPDQERQRANSGDSIKSSTVTAVSESGDSSRPPGTPTITISGEDDDTAREEPKV